MTTNYDTAYEDLCMRGEGRDGYHVLNYYDTGLTNRLRSRTRLILKLHGSVKAPEQTVLTRADYFKARAGHPQFFSVIQSLFVTNTILFIGYSLSDPDIQLLLENSNIGGDLSYRHYAVVPQGTHGAITRAISESYGINVVEYDAGKGHGVVTQSLMRLAEFVTKSGNTFVVMVTFRCGAEASCSGLGFSPNCGTHGALVSAWSDRAFTPIESLTHCSAQLRARFKQNEAVPR